MSKVRAIAILLHPEDGYLNNSAPVASGSLVNGTVYLVKYSQIVYNSTVYAANSTFTATATTTFTGQGTVYLNSQVEAYDETDPYPASGEMIRAIELEILTKEFGIEAGQIADIRNDSIDDTQKQR
jgi:polyisoprenoid-binding protein YceI